MRLITVEEYLMGREAAYHSDYTVEIAMNARATTVRINAFLQQTGFDGHVNCGWRPPAVNVATAGAAPHSKHLLALACDLHDADEVIDKFITENPQVLENLSLWREDSMYTPGWCHLQTVQYASWVPGKTRTFVP